MNLVNKLKRPKIKTSPRTVLDQVWMKNLDSLLIMKQKPWYSVDARINYELLIDKSKGECHRRSDKFNSSQEPR